MTADEAMPIPGLTARRRNEILTHVRRRTQPTAEIARALVISEENRQRPHLQTCSAKTNTANSLPTPITEK